MAFPENDEQFRDHEIATVEPFDGGGWAIALKGWASFCVPADSPVVPVPGMVARLYGRGFGYVVRGLFLDGERVFYLTEAEQAAKHRREAEERDRERRYDFEKNRIDLDRRYRVLPEVFRRRLDRFRANNPDFRWEYEPYELFVCEQAVVIAAALDANDRDATVAAFDAFRDMGWEEQKARVPGLDDDHSGNTFGCACLLAWLYLTDPESVVKIHGALAPLVGSVEYGCVPRESKP